VDHPHRCRSLRTISVEYQCRRRNTKREAGEKTLDARRKQRRRRSASTDKDGISARKKNSGPRKLYTRWKWMQKRLTRRQHASNTSVTDSAATHLRPSYSTSPSHPYIKAYSVLDSMVARKTSLISVRRSIKIVLLSVEVLTVTASRAGFGVQRMQSLVQFEQKWRRWMLQLRCR